MNEINVIIHKSEYVKLGGERHFHWNQQNVSAPFWRLYWNPAAGACVRVNGKVWELMPDLVYLMPPRTVYSTWLKNELEHFYIHFSLNVPFSPPPPDFFSLSSPGLVKMAEETAENFREDSGRWQTVLGLRALVICSLLQLPADAMCPMPQYHPKIKKVLGILSARNHVTNRELAMLVGMSVNSLLTLFRKETGIPPQTWSRIQRLERACTMLHFTEMSIDEIAASSGFYDRYHFSRAFQEIYHHGPAQYRRQARMK